MQTPRPASLRFTPAAIMAGSQLFQDYRRAFALACGLVPGLRNPGSGTLTARRAHPSGRRSFPPPPADSDQPPAPTSGGPAPLGATVVPVRTGNRVIALLQLGQVPSRGPSRAEVGRVLRLIGLPAARAETEQMETALWQARALSPAQHASLVQLLEIFSRQLAAWYAQHASTGRPTEPGAILRAKEWIEAHYHEPLTLRAVAKVAQMSPAYFCRSFHRATGLGFGEFLGRTRLAHVRQLLADPHNAIAETAFAAGFQSISQFNRTFLKLVGQSPTEYRAALEPRPSAAVAAPGEHRGLASPLLQPDAA